MTGMNKIAAWDNHHIYEAIGSPDFIADYKKVIRNAESIEELNEQLASANDGEVVALLRTIQKAFDKTFTTLSELQTFVFCVLSLDGTDSEAKKWREKLNNAKAQLTSLMTPQRDCLATAPSDTVDEFLADSAIQAHSFAIELDRACSKSRLSSETEATLSTLSTSGLHAWGDFYKSLQSSLEIGVELPAGMVETVSPGKARAMLAEPDEDLRMSAFIGLTKAWGENKDTCTAILNSISGWRLAEDKLRSIHFLDPSLREARIRRQTLDVMVDVVRQNRELGHKIFDSMARALNKKALHPWDWYAPAPTNEELPTSYSYDECLELISSSFSGISKDMGEFIKLMDEKGWIDNRILPTKSAMPFCCFFHKSREPRVSIGFSGTSKNLQTLAHELGHAYHYWVMRKLASPELVMPRPLAETASIFSQNAMSEILLGKSTSTQDRLELLWGMGSQIRTFFFHDLSFFDFEYEFYERRAKGTLSPIEIEEIFIRHWTNWFGPHFREDDQRWLRTIFPFMTNVRFYNYPYAFGYLFALALEGKRQEDPTEFAKLYEALLIDTGRMTLEDLAKKHLGANLQEPEFWQKGIRVVEDLVARFEETVNEWTELS